MSGGPTNSKRKPLFADTYLPVRLPWTYRPLAAVVVLIALLQPLIYFATMTGTVLGVMWWAVEGLELVGLGSWGGAGGGVGYRGGVYIFLFKGALYLTPFISGVMVILIMLGSLAPSRAGPRIRAYPLARVEHPLIYAYVEKLCDIMGAPPPVRIELSPDANASASFDHDGLWLVRRRLVLTIGATLVAGMTRRELTGVIAHELGHFTQGVGMRGTRLVSSINTWFLRVVYQRGAVDDFLEDLQESGWWVFVILGSITALLVLLVRLFIRAVASGAQLATAAMLRRMEFAADRCATRVAGSAAAVRAMARVEELAAGFENAMKIAELEGTRMRLPADLSLLARELAPALDRDAGGFILGYRDHPSAWSSHPPTGERVRIMHALAEPGIVLTDGPATKLLPGFEQLSRHATRFTLERAAGGALNAYRMMSVDEVLGRGEHAPEARPASVVSPLPASSAGPKGEIRRPALEDDSETIPLAD